MNISNLQLPEYFKEKYSSYQKLNPIQEKALEAGLLENKSQLICAPTASGKTFVASMAIANTLETGKCIYLVPLKALAKEKYTEFTSMLKGTNFTTIMSTGEIDSVSSYLAKYDLLILTTEKLDSLIRHRVTWLSEIKLVVIDEIHLLNDASRGPTLEVIITLLKQLISPQIIGLSATIGNPQILAKWLEATLVKDSWRPVELHKGIATSGNVEFYQSTTTQEK